MEGKHGSAPEGWGLSRLGWLILGAMLAHSRGCVGHSWAIFGLCGAISRLCLAYRGPLLPHLDLLLAQLRHMSSDLASVLAQTKRKRKKNWAIWKPNPQGPRKPHAMEGKHARLAHFGCHVGPQSGLCWPLLGLGWPILGAMLAHLGAMLTHRGVILTQLGGYVGPS